MKRRGFLAGLVTALSAPLTGCWRTLEQLPPPAPIRHAFNADNIVWEASPIGEASPYRTVVFLDNCSRGDVFKTITVESVREDGTLVIEVIDDPNYPNQLANDVFGNDSYTNVHISGGI